MLAILLLAVGPPASTQTASQKAPAINGLVTSYVSNHHVPGLSVAVIDQGHIILTQGYGLADVENNVAATSDTTTSFIAAVAVMDYEAGKLDLDVPIQTYCPDFPRKPWPITTRELLSHQSGIRDYRNKEETVNTKHYSSIKESLTQFANDPLEFEPGTKMQYTSYGYIVLGCVIEGASGTSYDRYMHQAVFEPAQMPATRLDDVFDYPAPSAGVQSYGQWRTAKLCLRGR
ncbi:MAG: serine hydrolase domain-containing protein [Candidatus Acidiferrales bacterium]